MENYEREKMTKEKNIINNWSYYMTFPCKPNSKIPATRQGFKDAKLGQDVTTLSNQGYNVALALSMSGLIAFDLDYHDENSTADEDLKLLEEKLGKLPKTITQSTATGKGKHLIFLSKGITNPIGRIGHFCDVKYNGYIMIAPSVINGKQYQIIDGIDETGNFIIAELPKAWIDYINKDTNFNQQRAKKSEITSIEHIVYRDIDIEKMFNNCTYLRYCRDNADILSEPEWFSMISILAQIEDSDELIHNLSEPYPKYNYVETQKKIDNARKFGHSQSCQYLSENYSDICRNCTNSHKKEV